MKKTIYPQKATYALKHMEEEFKKLRQEIRFKECVGFENCMQIFKDHFEDMLRREKDYKLRKEEIGRAHV